MVQGNYPSFRYESQIINFWAIVGHEQQLCEAL